MTTPSDAVPPDTAFMQSISPTLPALSHIRVIVVATSSSIMCERRAMNLKAALSSGLAPKDRAPNRNGRGAGNFLLTKRPQQVIEKPHSAPAGPSLQTPQSKPSPTPQPSPMPSLQLLIADPSCIYPSLSCILDTRDSRWPTCRNPTRHSTRAPLSRLKLRRPKLP